MGSSLVSVNSVARNSAAALAVSFVVAIPALADKNAPELNLDPPMIVDPAIDQFKKDQGEDAPVSAPSIVVPAPGIAPQTSLNPVASMTENPIPDSPDKSSGSEEGPPDGRDDGLADGQSAAPVSSEPDAIIPTAETAPKPSMSCPADVVWLRGDFGKARFTVDVADTRSSRAQGLMNVPFMPASRGMLFVYEYPQKVAFWMKNTLIPLDIIYIDENGVVASIQANAIPGDVTPLPGEGLVQYVLEINGGMAADMGILPGVQIQHPAIFSPIWPCE
ncbi:DUF192 domain-containing protein [Pelagimonas varians]|uniref:ACR n=1 Tax=Pelagimonas varians TaxID=696760 RepID=A0A238K8R7_9RHOB|nr:DUF192 domain-containing protein [Pelagimonas varians]PYG31875.1 uncharacterized membrane protein (UPF0127 family) [Pelagimonas varians]SMX38482.1 hypothetical protein PEV8663_01345 [Pelagimonas varians]